MVKILNHAALFGGLVLHLASGQIVFVVVNSLQRGTLYLSLFLLVQDAILVLLWKRLLNPGGRRLLLYLFIKIYGWIMASLPPVFPWDLT